MEKAKFFCEGCGQAVPSDADICPECGNSFNLVKCSQCLFTGQPAAFTDGCPECGYMKPPIKRQVQNPPSNQKKLLSARVYAIAISFFILLLILFFYLFTRL